MDMMTKEICVEVEPYQPGMEDGFEIYDHNDFRAYHGSSMTAPYIKDGHNTQYIKANGVDIDARLLNSTNSLTPEERALLEVIGGQGGE